MRDLYLLAVTLLTGLAIPTSTLPQLSIILQENSQIEWNLQQGSQLTLGRRIKTPVDISLPELSNQALQPLQGLPRLTASSLNALPQGANRTLLSGSQLYDQRLAQINTGQIYQPVNDHSPQSWGDLAKTASSLTAIPQGSKRTLLSGSQLYYQRVAELKTGQIYKPVNDDSLQSLWESAKKNQLTYEDWKNLLAVEAKALAQNQGANNLSILVGDSLSMWFPTEKLPEGKLWLNQGISGDTSSGVFKRLVAFSATRPDVIYVMAGINDLRKGTSDQVILRNHRQIMRRLRQNHPQAQIIIQSILPTRLPTIPNRRIRHINAQLAVMAKEEKVNYHNIHSWFTDFEGNLRFDLTTDGLHLSPQGYDVWRAAIEQIELKVTKRE